MSESYSYTFSFTHIFICFTINTTHNFFWVFITLAIFTTSIIFNNQNISTISFTRISISNTIFSTNWLYNIWTITSSTNTFIIFFYTFTIHHTFIIISLSIISTNWSVISSITITFFDTIRI